MGFAFNILDVSDAESSENAQDEVKNDILDEISDIAAFPILGQREPQTQRRTTRAPKKRAARGFHNVPVPKRPKTNILSKSAVGFSAKSVKAHLNVGLDFGTTFSGVSYRSNLDADDNQIHTIKTWPDGMKHGQYLLKMPSRIAYMAENNCWGADKKCLDRDVIGYEVMPGMVSYTWFKLLLDDRADPTEYDDPSLRSAVGQGTLKLPAGKTAVDVAADFLTIFRAIILTELAKPITNLVLGRLPIHWWVTVPAIWDDNAQLNTTHALQRAGFEGRARGQVTDQFDFVSEPEAAAVAALKKTYAQNHSLLKDEMRVLIMDIGGRTIDGGCMKVRSLAPLKLETIGTGEGGKSGSTSIDRRFIAFMLDHFGQYFSRIAETKRGPGSKFMNSFEAEKKAFQGGIEETFRLPLPALAEQLRARKLSVSFFDNDEAEVVLQGKHMVDFFKETILQTCNLIQRQVAVMRETDNEKPDVIILAGGLSGSNYVFQQVARFCMDSLGQQIEVIRPDDAWGAISYGAVMYGMDRTLTISRTARRHYCMIAQRKFSEGVDPEERAVECRFHGKRTEGSLIPLLKKGEKINERTSRYTRGYIIVDDLRPQALEYSYKILCSKDDNAPQWEDDEGVFAIAELKIDLSPLMKLWGKQGYWAHNAASRPIKVWLNIVVSGGHEAGMMHIQANAKHRKWEEYISAKHNQDSTPKARRPYA